MSELVFELTRIVGSRREARWIAEDASGRAHGLELAGRRASGEPLQHVLGHWGFRGLDVAVDKRALVPRPETEVVAGVAIAELGLLQGRRRGPLRAADLGTGSGVIACCLVAELGNKVHVYATDISADALALASENAEQVLGDAASQVELSLGSWFEALSPSLARSLDLVVSNPPYLASSEWPGLEPVVRDHDPYDALVAGPLGTEAIDHLIEESVHWLTPEGSLVVEIAPHQSSAVLARARARFASAEVRCDLAERPRVLLARR
ncbi:MAG: HemK/PrmC family methyltransferase [Acidimicrobiales bacterium]